MKLLRNIFAIVLALALITPSFALSEALTESRDYGKIILTDTEKQDIYKLLDDTIAKRDEKFQQLMQLQAQIKENQFKKKKQRALAIGIPVSIVATALAVVVPACAIMAVTAAEATNTAVAITCIVAIDSSLTAAAVPMLETHNVVKSSVTAPPGGVIPWINDDTDRNMFLPEFARETKKRLARYDAAKRAYLEGEISTKKMFKAQDKFIKTMANLFMDDPASGLDIIAAKRELFPAMIENDPKVIKMLKNYNKVISADLEDYSDYAVEKLAHANAEKYFERLAEYIEIKNKQKAIDAVNKALVKEIKATTDKSKARKVAIKEIKKQGKAEEKDKKAKEKAEEIEKIIKSGGNTPVPIIPE